MDIINYYLINLMVIVEKSGCSQLLYCDTFENQQQGHSSCVILRKIRYVIVIAVILNKGKNY